MAKGLVIYQNRDITWNWLSIQFVKSCPRLFFWSISINKPYKQWFANCSIFPFFFQKNNAHWIFGISFIVFTIQLKYQF